MTAFSLAAGTDWIRTVVFGSPADRWRLDDYDIAAQLRPQGASSPTLTLSTANGRLSIADAEDRRLEINAAWSAVTALGDGPFEFDFLFTNKTTGIKARSEVHTLSIAAGVTPSD